MTNLEKIRKLSEDEMAEILNAATRNDISYFDICTTKCHKCVLMRLCSKWEKIKKDMCISEWKKWLNEEVKE